MEDREYINLLSDDPTPEYFSLRFESNPPSIVFGFCEGLLGWFLSEMHKWPIYKMYKKLAKNSEFSVELGTGIGFGNVMRELRIADYFAPSHFQEFFIEVPVVENVVGDCPHCCGTGDDDYFGACIWCFGSGKKTEMRFDILEQVCLTVSFLSQTIIEQIPARFSRSNGHYQLITFMTQYPKEKMGGAGISAVLSRKVIRLLMSKTNKDILEVSHATRLAYKTMFPLSRISGFGDFEVRLWGGRLSFDVPGNATGLMVEGTDRVDGSSAINLYPHNVDSMPQQLGLLCGLAALSGLVIQNR